MADNNDTAMGENTREGVALKLLRVLILLEDAKVPSIQPQGKTTVDGTWLLQAYADCLTTVSGEEPPKRGTPPRR